MKLSLSYTIQKHCLEKNREASLTSCPIDFVSPKTPPLSPLSGNKAPTGRRTSERLASCAQKRSYVDIQMTNGRVGKSKRPKPLAPEPEVSGPTTSESIPSGSTVKDSISSECAIEDFLNTESAAIPSAKPEALEALADDAHRQCSDQMLSRADEEPIGQCNEDFIHALNHNNRIHILEGYFSDSALDLGHVDEALAPNMLPNAEDEHSNQDCSSNQSTHSESLPTLQYQSYAEPSTTLPIQSLQADSGPEMENANNNPPSAATETPLAKRAILDESGHRLEDVMKALDKAGDTSRIPNSCIPGVLDYLHPTSNSTDYSKILTSISMNCVRQNRQRVTPTLDIEQERLRNYKRHELERIAEDRQQINITLPARIASEINLQQYTKRLKKTTEYTIARLDIKDLTEKELLDTISEPTKLTGEFREESDYTSAIKQIEKGIANDTRTRQRSL